MGIHVSVIARVKALLTRSINKLMTGLAHPLPDA
jgi:hypothetical protein